MSIALDHVIYTVPDLAVAAERFLENFGLASVDGGAHPDFGTGNRIVPLGDGYLELMGVVDAAVAAGNPIGSVVTDHIESGGGFLGWIVRTDDLDGVCARLGLDAVPGDRTRPDGSTIRWRATGIERLLTDPSLPFFIEWEDPDAHPGRDTAIHPTEPHGISWIEVGPHPGLSEWLGPHDLDLRVTGARPGPTAIGIALAQGEIEIR